MKISRIAFFPFLSLLIVACNHPIEIVGDGDVTSASGNRNCYLEDYKASKDNCTKNTVVGEYKETYSALPKEGWIFEGWDGCQIAVGDECSFDISGEAVIKAWGATAPSLTATFIKSTLPAKPVDSGIYGIDYASNSRLLIINEFTGVTKIVGRVGKRVTDIAFIGDQLFGITFSDLLAIDTSGGQGKTIGYTGYASLNALASYRGKLFAASTSGELIEIDTDTGEGKFIGYFGSGLHSAGDLVFDEAGNLYGTVAGGGSIFGSFSNTELATVNIATGQATVIGDTGFRDVWGLTITSHSFLGATGGGQLLRINEKTGAASLLYEDKTLVFSGLASGSSIGAVDNFVADKEGICTDMDGAYGCQCVDLMHSYIEEVLGVPRSDHNIRGNAYPIYAGLGASTTISSGTHSVRLEKIDYTPTGTPQKGDIIFWTHSDGVGHVGIFLSGDANNFQSLDQNWVDASVANGSAAARVNHINTGNYSVAGWLRPVLLAN